MLELASTFPTGSKKEMHQLEERFISGTWTPSFLETEPVSSHGHTENSTATQPLGDSSNLREPPAKKKRGSSCKLLCRYNIVVT